MIVKNAQIEETMLGIEDHGIMTCMLHLKIEEYVQGFGGHALDEPYKEKGKFVERRGSAYGMDWVIGIIRAVGVEKWEDLEGKYLRVRYADDRLNAPIIAIGNITEDNWFVPSVLKDRYFPEEEK